MNNITILLEPSCVTFSSKNVCSDIERTQDEQ